MSDVRWQKVRRDLFARQGRSALAVLAMAAGVFEIGAMLYKYALLEPELTGMYARTQPASATLTVDSLSDALVDSVRHVPGVAAAEARPIIIARVKVAADEWMPSVLYVVRDFDHQQIDLFTREAGTWPPGDDEILLERTALQVARAKPGDRMVLRTAAGGDQSARLAGTVHAPGLPPAWMEHMVPGFVSWRSRLRAGGNESAQLRIIVANHPLDEGYIHEVTDSVSALLERNGRTIDRVTVPTPGRHPHADQMEAFLYLILAFGVLSFALSAVLVAGMIQAHMAEQMKQIGMMKAVGASDRQVAGLYLGEVAALAVAALAIGIPPGLLVGQAYAEFAAGILNTSISQRPFPVALVLAEIVVGVLVPVLVALVPILRASRITVREALSDDIRTGPRTEHRSKAWLTRAAWIPRPLLLSLRTTASRRARLALTVSLVAVSGAVFTSALNVGEAWTRSVDAGFRAMGFDIAVALAEPVATDRLTALLTAVPGVVRAEYWSGSSPYLVGANGVAGAPVTLVGRPSGSQMPALPVTAGRWLDRDDANAAVVNTVVCSRSPGLGLGDSVRVRIEGRTLAFPVVGVVKELSPMPAIYVPRSAVLAATGQSADLARSIRIVTRDHDDAGQLAVAKRLERAFEGAGIEVRSLQRMRDARKGLLDHLVIIMSILTAASLVVVAVGGLGLTSHLTIQVIQRTREIGILGAIGATPGTIARHIWIESLVIGGASWVVAIVLAAPITYVLEAATGNIFFRAPLDFYMSIRAGAIWLGLVFALASLSSISPALRAARLTVTKALSHV